ELSKLVDRCLAYRREYNDLIANAVRQGLEYDLFSKQVDVLVKLDSMSWVEQLRRMEATNQHNAMNEFSADPGSVLARGFGSLASGSEILNTRSAEYE